MLLTPQSVFERGITMSSPRTFSEVVSMASVRTLSYNSSSDNGELEYAVLLILTAGCPEDIDGDAQVVADLGRSGPLSVVICGVGDGDFHGLERFVARSHGGEDRRGAKRELLPYDSSFVIRFARHLRSRCRTASNTAASFARRSGQLRPARGPHRQGLQGEDTQSAQGPARQGRGGESERGSK